MNKKMKDAMLIGAGITGALAAGFVCGCLKMKYMDTTKCIVDSLGPLV